MPQCGCSGGVKIKASIKSLTLGVKMAENRIYDCIIVGAGPGGLQAAIHLARYNRRVLLINRGGGRTSHAGNIVNYLGLEEVAGRQLIQTGLEQAVNFGVEIMKVAVTGIKKNNVFEVHTADGSYQSRFVILSAGAVDHQPSLRNMGRFFGKGYYTCLHCDGYQTTGKELVVMGNSINAARLVLVMKQMYTEDIALLLRDYTLPLDYQIVIEEEGIAIFSGEPVALLGETELEGVQLADDRKLSCQAVMATFGWHLNDTFLEGLSLNRDSDNFKILTNSTNETSEKGLYVVGAMKAGPSQAIIAAGQGAVAAIDINHQLLGLNT